MIINAVIPVWKGGHYKEKEALEKAIENAFTSVIS